MIVSRAHGLRAGFQAQFGQKTAGASQFAQNYFHFQLSFSFEQPNAMAVAAIMANGADFKKQVAVTGGYVSGQVPAQTYEMHVYGLKNGSYSLVSFIDTNRNGKLDFAPRGGPTEPYGLFTDVKIAKKGDLTFESTSMAFDAGTSARTIRWVKAE